MSGVTKPEERADFTAAATQGGWSPSDDFLRRLRAAYELALRDHTQETSFFWSNLIPPMSKAVHDALLGNGDLRFLVSNPRATNLYFGMDCLCLGTPQKAWWGEAHAELKRLRRLCEAIGVIRLYNPEGGLRVSKAAEQPEPPPADEMLSLLPGVIDYPNPFPDEVGLVTSRGVATERATSAIYQAHRLMECLVFGDGNPACLEIGAGMGRTAYYAYRLGLTDYTIIDLPMALVGQACFLGATLGEDAVSLPGEDHGEIKLRAPQWLNGSDKEFSIALNVDSLTEMSLPYAIGYIDFIKSNARLFLSINHEANEFTVRDLIKEFVRSRHPYPMRDGYVEEFAVFRA